MILKEISFEQIRGYWKEYLWPKRTSVIEKKSAINSQGQIDMQIMFDLQEPLFFSLQNSENEICAVSSIFKTQAAEYRLRGTWVHEKYQGQGLGGSLVRQILKNCISHTETVWTLSRSRNVGFYEKLGFEKNQKIDQYEYGPHYTMFYRRAHLFESIKC